MLLPSGPADARLMIVADAVSYRDVQSNTILSDREFDKIFSEAGGNRSRCFVTALMRTIFPGQDPDRLIAKTKKEITPMHMTLHDRHVLPELLAGLSALEKDIDLVKPKVILALGNAALFALTGKLGIKSWRSSILDYTSPGGHHCHIIPTYPASYVYSVWKERNTIIHDCRKAWTLAQSDLAIQAPDYNFIIEPSFSIAASALQSLLDRVSSGPTKLSVDIETRGGHIACIGIAWSSIDAICIPLLRATNILDPNWQRKVNYWLEEEETFLTQLLYEVLTHLNAEVVGQNFLYDAQYFVRHLCYCPRFKRDTMLAQHSMFSNMPKGLDFLSSLHSSYHIYWKDESKNWDPKLGERQLWIYNCKDACVTYEIDDSQQAAIEAMLHEWPKLREVHDFQQSLFYPVLDTMVTGIRVANETKHELSEELSAAIAEREAWLLEVVGHPLNIKSPLQMKDFFYRELAQKTIISRKTGNPTTDDAALEKISTREPLLKPLCDTIRDLRSLGVFRSTFLEAPVDHDQRMRCSFNIAGTETYRFSSSENAFGSGMNLQNIPSGDD